MDYKMKNGASLSDADFEKMSDDAAKGIYPGAPGKWVVRPQGRPPLCDEELVTVAFKVPRSQRDEIDRVAASRNETRSQFMREALVNALSTC